MDKPPCICGCGYQWHIPGGGSCTKCRSRCFGYVEEYKMTDFADHTFEPDASPEGHCQICGDPQNLHPQQGFSVEPTGMMAQVRQEGEQSVPFEESPVSTQSEIFEREASLEVPTEGVIMEAGEPVLESDPSSEISGTIQQTPVPMGKVTICRMVEYRSRTGNYTVPAVVNCTTQSIYQPGVEAGFVPPLSSPAHVHLTVFSPGMRIDAGTQPGSENFVVESSAKRLVNGEWVPMPVSENVAGCYQEWDIPYDPDGGPGTWRWPTRV